MRYILVSKRSHSTQRDALFIEKAVKFGEKIREERIKKTCNVLIVGAHSSSKSRYLKKLYDNAEPLYLAQCRPYTGRATNSHRIRERDPAKKVCKHKLGRKDIEKFWKFPEPVFVSCQESLSDWVNHEGVRELYESEMLLDFKKATLKVKGEWMAKYLKETNAVLFVDDIDKLTGRKLQVVKEMVHSAFRVLATCKSENAIHPSIRIAVLESDPQILRLESDTAYDITPYFLFFIMIPILMTIDPMLAVLAFVGGVGKFAHGQFATRQK